MPKFDDAVIVDQDGMLRCRIGSPLLRVMAPDIAALFDGPLIGRVRYPVSLNDTAACSAGGVDEFGVVQPARTAGTIDVAYPIGWEPE